MSIEEVKVRTSIGTRSEIDIRTKSDGLDLSFIGNSHSDIVVKYMYSGRIHQVEWKSQRDVPNKRMVCG